MAAVGLPGGIVTFVFTDIEGSTRLLHRLGDRYAGLLERHREILRRAWKEHGGHEVSVTGDASVAVFARPDEAVAACAVARRQLAEEAWPDGVEVRVRFGVHRGLASPHDGDYVALAAHQAARVMAAAHGGQILVSEQVAAELDPPPALDLRPLGRFRVRDFDAPVALHELAGTTSPALFPSPRAVPADGHNLVGRTTATIGRAEIVSAVADQLEPGRLLTLVGAGGVGKTRVATDVGIAVAPKWDDGVWLVELAGVGTSDLVPAAIADAIGVPTDPVGDRWDHLLAYLAGRRAVVLLDSCEHLVVTCRELVAQILASVDGIGVLATSREPLRVEGESLWHVPPLELPAGPSPHEILASPAGRLFAERGSAARPGFVVDDGNAAAVAELCRHLDGLPLLIELAAAHLSAQSPAEILTGLEDRPRLLRAPPRAASDRHSTVVDLLDWSYRLLSGDEQACFRALSVFATSFSQSTAAAAAAGTGVDPAEVSHLLWSLVDRSLVTADLGANDTRYRLLETVRSHGRDLLDEHVETGAVATGLADTLLDRLGPWYPADRRWIGKVGVEVDNLRGLVDLIPSDQQESAQQVACAIARWHDATQSFREGIREVTRYVETLDARTPTRVSLLAMLAYLHLRTGDVERAERLTDEAEALQALNGSPDWDDVAVERTRGEIALRGGKHEEAVAIAERALERHLTERGRSRMYNLLGIAKAALGDLEAAYDALLRELELNRAVGYEIHVASAHGNLAETALRLGEHRAAARHQRDCLELAVALGSSTMVAFSLIVAARLAGVAHGWADAVRLHARAEALLEEIGLALYDDDRREIEAMLLAARRELAPERYAAAYDDGRDMDLAAAIAEADRVLTAAENGAAG